MKKILRFIFSRMVIVAISLMIQMALLLAMLVWFEN